MENEIKLKEILYFIQHLTNVKKTNSLYSVSILLMQGVYINKLDYLSNNLIENYFNVLYIYYDTFFGLILRKGKSERGNYYYLSFADK